MKKTEDAIDVNELVDAKGMISVLEMTVLTWKLSAITSNIPERPYAEWAKLFNDCLMCAGTMEKGDFSALMEKIFEEEQSSHEKD